MNCPKCNSNNCYAMVNVTLKISPEDIRQLSKKSINKKSTELLYANWEQCTFVCNDCHNIFKGL